MTNTNLKEYYIGLPAWARGVVVVGGLAVTGLLLYKLFKKKPEASDATANVEKTITDLTKTQKPSYKSEMYSTFANTIHENGKYCTVGNNYDTVETALKKMNNDLDVALLIKAFGKRQGSCYGFNTGEPVDLITFGNTYVFDGWYDHKRADSVNAEWKKKGITYQFV